MRDFLPVLNFLLVLSVIGISQETTRGFRRCFPDWINASQVKVSCEKENVANATKIAQYCDDQIRVCRKMNNTGVSLEKEQEGLCLNITNDSYNSWYCEAQSYIDDQEKKDNFTINVSYNITNPSPSAGATDASPSQETADKSLSQDLTNTSPSSNQWLYARVITVITVITVIAVITVFIVIIVIIVNKVKSSRENTGLPNSRNQLDIERGENEALRENRETLENKFGREQLALAEVFESQD